MPRWPFFLPFFALACSEYEVTNLTTEDSFTQTEEPPADVLFVVDDSASMAEEQQNLSANFGAFLELLGDTTADFRLGVTTTDPLAAACSWAPCSPPIRPMPSTRSPPRWLWAPAARAMSRGWRWGCAASGRM